jgi:colanic acid biosynthesis protein WcaH
VTFIPKEEYDKILECLPILCVDCVITYEGKCLLLRRANEPAKGHYWFPGGRINKGELIADAAIRKACEETSLTCQFDKIISIEETMFPREGNMVCDVHTVNVCCHLVTLSQENIRVDNNHDDYVWANIEQALQLKVHEGVINPMRKFQ